MPSPGGGSPVGGAISGVNSGLRLTPRLCAEGLTSVTAAAADCLAQQLARLVTS